MIADDGFARDAADRYVADTRETLGWMLGRLDRRIDGDDRASPPSAFVDTKVNPLTLEDYTVADGLRGPGFTYDWIQGRALEALCTHAAFFERRDSGLAARLDVASARLHAALATAVGPSVEAAFCRDPDGVPVRTTGHGAGRARRREPGLRCYGDVFAVKGLIAAASRHGRAAELERHLGTLADIVDAVDEGRFLRDERGDVDAATLAREGEEYGPRMILLGASALLARLRLGARDDFSERFVDSVLARHRDPASGLLADAPGGTTCNVGHGIELVGLALETLRGRLSPALRDALCDLLVAHAGAGFAGPGIALEIEIPTGRATGPYRPWWSLPETVRAAALAHEASGRQALLGIWRRAHDDYFDHYRRAALPIAYQTLTADGPVDHVPATPDLDPAYHTGLSLLAAIECVERRPDMSGRAGPPRATGAG